MNWFIDVFDWDRIVVSQTIKVGLTFKLLLCTSIFPCALSFSGNPVGKIEQSGSAYISCLSMLGCSGIQLDAIDLVCMETDNSNAVFEIDGSILNIVDSSMSGCASNKDGGAIQSYNGALVTLYNSSFLDLYSAGFGGAIAAFGSDLSIVDTSFKNCTSKRGGGAIWSSAFQKCYGSILPSTTNLKIHNSIFKNCRSQNTGGAILADSNASADENETLNIEIFHTKFSKCTADAEGGAFHASGALITSVISVSEFESCVSFASGGALSSINSASLALLDSVFKNNTAYGLGGGALHFKNSFFFSNNASIFGNKAPNGGGGGIFWQRSLLPATSLCPLGSRSVNYSCAPDAWISKCILNKCVLCDAGTFQDQQNATVCFFCQTGTYSEVQGSSGCMMCPAGQYSSVLQANGSHVCSVCGAGLFSNSGDSICSLCTQGTYSEYPGVSVCVSCDSGKYSSAAGANHSGTCSVCESGYFSDYGASVCSPCNPGTYSELSGSEECTSCVAGTYSGSLGAKVSGTCRMCSSGQFSYVGASECFSCDGERYPIMPSTFGDLYAFSKSRIVGFELAVSDPLLACSALNVNMTGKVVLILRGKCQFGLKAMNAQLAGAVAVVVFDDQFEILYTMLAGISGAGVAIPVGFISQIDGNMIQTCAANQRLQVYISPFENTLMMQLKAVSPSAHSIEVPPLCTAGEYVDMAVNTCISCSSGKFSAGAGANSSLACTTCPAGFYSGSGSSGCSLCMTGVYTASTYFSQKNAFDFSQCTPLTAHNGSVGRIAINDRNTGQYGNNENMFWLIAPSGASSVSLVFQSFDTEKYYDVVNVYSCQSINCSAQFKLIGSFSGPSLPAPVNTSTGIMLVTWKSDVNILARGWVATYSLSAKKRLRSSQVPPTTIFVNDSYNVNRARNKYPFDIHVKTSNQSSVLLPHSPENYTVANVAEIDPIKMVAHCTAIRKKYNQCYGVYDEAKPIFPSVSTPKSIEGVSDSEKLSKNSDSIAPRAFDAFEERSNIDSEILFKFEIPKKTRIMSRCTQDERKFLDSIRNTLHDNNARSNDIYNSLMLQTKTPRERELFDLLSNTRNNAAIISNSKPELKTEDALPSYIDYLNLLKLQNIKSSRRHRKGLLESYFISTYPITNDLCGANNVAVFGSCIASDFDHLHVTQRTFPVFAGIPFVVAILKKDAYNQTIVTDSSSLLQALTYTAELNESTSSFLVGPTIAKLRDGEGIFSFGIKPTFALVDPQRMVATLQSLPSLYFEGLDAQTEFKMISAINNIDLEQGETVCPPGYILALDQEGATSGLAACIFCKAGSYSIHPLAHVPGSSSAPSCLNCPAGGDCTRGGADVEFKVGTWADQRGIYALFSCPPGYQLINSTAGTSKGVFSSNLQQCRPCQPGQYIINPDSDDCKDCPLGDHKVCPLVWGLFLNTV